MAEQQFHSGAELRLRVLNVNSLRETPELHLPEAAELEFLALSDQIAPSPKDLLTCGDAPLQT